jgi:hypothetical protein
MLIIDDESVVTIGGGSRIPGIQTLFGVSNYCTAPRKLHIVLTAHQFGLSTLRLFDTCQMVPIGGGEQCVAVVAALGRIRRATVTDRIALRHRS